MTDPGLFHSYTKAKKLFYIIFSDWLTNDDDDLDSRRREGEKRDHKAVEHSVTTLCPIFFKSTRQRGQMVRALGKMERRQFSLMS